jgi:hypothetical protein
MTVRCSAEFPGPRGSAARLDIHGEWDQRDLAALLKPVVRAMSTPVGKVTGLALDLVAMLGSNQ